MIHVLATIELAQGQRDSFLTEFRKVVPLVRAESGCIEYGAAVDVAASLPVETPLRPDTVVIVEKWESLDALRAHLGAAHMIEYRQRIKDFVRRVSLQVMEPV
jgi:quinol monooxygenase YgiN